MESGEIENKNDKDRSNISIKKSSFNGLIIALLVIGVVAAFFAGSYLSNLNFKYITQDELDDVVAKLELKMVAISTSYKSTKTTTQNINR